MATVQGLGSGFRVLFRWPFFRVWGQGFGFCLGRLDLKFVEELGCRALAEPGLGGLGCMGWVFYVCRFESRFDGESRTPP